MEECAGQDNKKEANRKDEREKNDGYHPKTVNNPSDPSQ
jgi:hypothetical protein